MVDGLLSPFTMKAKFRMLRVKNTQLMQLV